MAYELNFTGRRYKMSLTLKLNNVPIRQHIFSAHTLQDTIQRHSAAMLAKNIPLVAGDQLKFVLETLEVDTDTSGTTDTVCGVMLEELRVNVSKEKVT